MNHGLEVTAAPKNQEKSWTFENNMSCQWMLHLYVYEHFNKIFYKYK